MPQLEIACFNAESAKIAAKSGADRIELCANANVGGTTPAISTLQEVKKVVPIPVFVMIRCRGGNFNYSRDEYQIMQQELRERTTLANGFVFGFLTGDGKVDVERNSELVKLAGLKPCTFHRAFDEIDDPVGALHALKACGFANVLTSGGASSAPAGVDMLADLVEGGNTLGLNIMPGGGVRSSNVMELRSRTHAEWYHSSAVVDDSGVANAEEVAALKNALF